MADIKVLEDRLAIRELIERYSTAVSTKQFDVMGSVFHPHATWHVGAPLNKGYETREKIQAGISASVARYDCLVQMSHSSIIELDGDRATACTIMNEVGRHAASNSRMELLGTYNDVITRIDARWGFESRRFECLNVDAEGPLFTQKVAVEA